MNQTRIVDPAVAGAASAPGRGLDRIASVLASWRRRPRWGYALSLALFALALGLRFALDASLPAGFPFLTFFPAVVLAAFLGGLGPGALCAALSGLASWYWFVPPVHSFALTAASALALGLFVFICVVDVVVIELMTRAVNNLSAEQERTAQLLMQRNTLFQELQHRVANQLAAAAARMALVQKRLSHLPEAAAMVAQERRGFDALARIHRALHDPQMAERPWLASAERVVGDFLRSQGAERHQVTLTGDPAQLDPDRAAVLLLWLLEALTNSLKHAWPDGRDGRVEIRLERRGRELALLVIDDGVGLATAAPAGEMPGWTHGLGAGIMAGLAESLGGVMSRRTAPRGGLEATLLFSA